MLTNLAMLKEGKYVHIWPFLEYLLGAMLRKLAILKMGKYVHLVTNFAIPRRCWENWPCSTIEKTFTHITFFRAARAAFFHSRGWSWHCCSWPTRNVHQVALFCYPMYGFEAPRNRALGSKLMYLCFCVFRRFSKSIHRSKTLLRSTSEQFILPCLQKQNLKNNCGEVLRSSVPSTGKIRIV